MANRSGHRLLCITRRYCISSYDSPVVNFCLVDTGDSLTVSCCGCKKFFRLNSAEHCVCTKCSYQLCPACSELPPAKEGEEGAICDIHYWGEFTRLWGHCCKCHRCFRIMTSEEIDTFPKRLYLYCPECRKTH